MKDVLLLQLADPDGYLEQIEMVYRRLRVVAERSNDLRSYLIADLMLVSIERGQWMMRDYHHREVARPSKKYYNWLYDPYVFQVEDSDTVEQILKKRFSFVYNGPVAAG